MSKVIIFVDVDIKAGMRDGYIKKLRKHAEGVRTEPGCEKLDMFISVEDPNRMYVWEIWSTRKDFDVHLICDATKAWRPVAAPFINGEKIHVMESI